MLIAMCVNVFFMRWLLKTFPPAAATISCLLETIVTFLLAFNKPYILTMQNIIGIFRGEKNDGGMRCCYKFALRRGLFAACIVGGFIFLLAEYIVQCFPVQENFPGEAIFAVRVVGASAPVYLLFQFLLSFYNVCGHHKLATTIAILAQAAIYLTVSVIFFFVIKKEECFWYYFAVTLVSDDIMAFLVIWAVMKKQHYRDIFLLPRLSDDFIRYYFLLINSPRELVDYREMVTLFLGKHQIAPDVIKRAKLLFEELFLFAREHTDKHTGRFFAMSVILYPDERLQITLHYDGNESCLKSVLNGVNNELPPEKIMGAMILKKMSDDIYIDRIYGFNYIRLTLREATPSVPEESGNVLSPA